MSAVYALSSMDRRSRRLDTYVGVVYRTFWREFIYFTVNDGGGGLEWEKSGDEVSMGVMTWSLLFFFSLWFIGL